MLFRRSRSLSLPALAAAGMVLFGASPFAVAATPTTLQGELADAAGKIAATLDRQAATSVNIESVKDPPRMSSGAEIVEVLTDELGKRKVTVDALAGHAIRIEYAALGDDPERKPGAAAEPLIRIEYEVIAPNGEPLNVIGGNVAKITDKEDFLDVAQPTVALRPDAPAADQKRAALDAVTGATAKIDPPKAEGTVVYPTTRRSQFGRYGVEILVDGKPKAPTVRPDGLITLDIARGQEYRIRLHNETDYHAAAEILIDGIGTFEFTEKRTPSGEPAYSKWVVPPSASATVPGWHLKDAAPNNLAAFEVAPYEESAAAKLDLTSDVGVILVKFSAAWEEGRDPPSDEPSTRRAVDATKIGRPLSEDLKPFIGDIGETRATVAIRYSRMQN